MIVQAKQGLFAVLGAIAIQLTLGIAYIWSVFQTGIAESIFNGDNAAAGLVFSLLLAFLAIGSLIGGRLVVRYTTRRVIFIGGILLGVGTFAASLVQPQFGWLLWLSYGVIGGLGMGFCYATTIACAQKWYPHKRGMITGVIVAALGMGGVIFTPLIEMMIINFGGFGVGEFNTFRVLSVVFLVVCCTGSIFMHTPPEGYMADKVAANSKTAAARNYTSKEMLRTPQCYILILAFVLSVVGGLMIIGFARPIAVAHGMEATATIGVLAIALLNSMGRLFWGAVSDRIGRFATLTILLIGTACLALLLGVVQGYIIYVVIALIGFCFGGILSNYGAITSDLFGAKYMAANYGIVLLGFGGGAIVATQVGGHFANIADLYGISAMTPAFIIAATCAGVGVVLMFILKGLAKKAAAQVTAE